MSDTKVETISRLAQWKIENFGPCCYKKSDPFKIGIWNWHLAAEKNRYSCIRLFPELSRVSKEQPPHARFILKVSIAGNRKSYTSQINERLFRCNDDFIWHVDFTPYGRFIIDVEFLDLKIWPTNGTEAIPIWPSDGPMQSVASQSTLRSLSRMLYEGIHADVTINTTDGSLRAHKAILSASSPVFASMFLHNLREKESSTIEIEDMTWESCMALLNYLYGSVKQEDFWKHRLALLGAANKYDIVDLKDTCEESLLEDINSGNVLERLQEAWLYQLNKLKKGCFMYLFDFCKIYDVKDEINDFFKRADRELMTEMFHESVNWTGRNNKCHRLRIRSDQKFLQSELRTQSQNAPCCGSRNPRTKGLKMGIGISWNYRKEEKISKCSNREFPFLIAKTLRRMMKAPRIFDVQHIRSSTY
ncbi:hypothetical protein Nepgr_019005 [Nepenthes gracilis]|uniref:BTB domain-containing protein n=1 Tax=Nepenthes gracilis TaxID=150966 RepID=A0AAD3SUZ0_NEPGR|nr:hypothetical protein Nepgr_019005 [Nepenthes gracilis]